MASTNILSFTDTDGETVKIAALDIFSIIDAGSYRIVKTFLPTKKYKSTGSLSTLKSEAENLFQVTEGGVDTLLNPITLYKIVSNGSGCEILFQGGEKILVSESVSEVEESIDAINSTSTFTVKTKSSSYTVLTTDDLVEFTEVATATLPAASSATSTITISATNGNVTVTPDGSDTIMGESSGLIENDNSWTLYPNGTNWIIR